MTPEGFAVAYERGYHLTMRFLRSRGASWEHASDVSQTAWTKGWERRDQLQNDGMVLTWVNTIALNIHRRFQRREPAWQDLPDIGTMPGVNLAAIDLARILRICGPRDRTYLKYQLSGMSPSEIARLRGVPESAIRVRLLRARRAARRRLERMGHPQVVVH
ncbi:MAG TPA: sigma-70 family RNA polymerase sigma factor [Bryobacteraceae bacterium]|nr:sigma-70 family RNA polymerase sigma factor [Bryobacteraceae bacterium]